MEKKTGGTLEELANGNHRSAAKCRGEVLAKAATGVALRRAVVFPVAQVKEI